MTETSDLHAVLLEKLSQNLDFNQDKYLKKLDGIPTDLERINYVYNQLRTHNVLPAFQEDIKCDVGCTGVRQNAERSLQEGRLVDSRNFYTHSLASAKSKEMLALAYAGRSAVLFKEEYYPECLEDIDRALNIGCPRNIRSKLFSRRKECQERKKPRSPDYEKIPKIKSSERSPEVHCAKNCLEICTNRQFGRHVIATKDIQIGEVIAVERPFSYQIWHYEYWCCHECLRVCYNMIPCDGCTQVYFCGTKCKEKASQSYHKYECPLLFTLKSTIPNAADRITFPLRILFQKWPEKDEIKDNLYRSDRWKEVSNLQIYWDLKDPMRVLSKLALVAGAFHLVKNHSAYFETGMDEDQFKLILLKMVLICEVNKVSIEEFSKHLGIFEKEPFGMGVYPFFSMFNHSCHQNISHYFHGTSMVMRANNSIKKGDQLYVNYGTNYQSEDKNNRQSFLLDNFFFTCSCIVCTEDWPTCGLLNNDKSDECTEIFFNMLRVVKCGDVQLAIRTIPYIIQNLQKVEKDTQSQNYVFIRFALTQMYSVLGNKRTY